MDIDDDNSEEILVGKKRRKGNSNVWKHFKLHPDKKNAKCLSCKKMYKTSGNTTNLLDHLKRSHPLLIEPTKSDPTLEGYFPKKSNSTYESNSSRKAELDSALARMIASDIQPFRIVEDKGFREFVQCLDPRYKLPSTPQVFTADEVEQLEDLCLLLGPFNANTNIISGNQYVTISHIIPIVWGLYSTMLKSKCKLKTAVGLDTCTYLAERIHQRLFIYETRSASRLATLLDPRFKKEGFRSAQNVSQAFAVLENELAEVKRITASTLEGDIQEPSTSKSMVVPEIYEFMKEKLSCKIKSNRADSIIALREYAEKPNEPLNSDPLEYWKTRTSDMRHLQILALRYLCIPATSSESERMFSKAGAVISDRRTRLKEKNVNMLLFINKNSWMIS